MANLNIIENFKETNTKSPNKLRNGVIQAKVTSLAIPRKLNESEFSGYEDITVTTPMVNLSEEDLNDLISPGLEYWADDDNTCLNKPSDSINGFGLKVSKISTDSIRQDLIEANDKKKWSRIKDWSGWSEWEYAYTSNNPQEVQAVVETAVKLQTARTIEISGLMSAKAKFDGSQDIVLEITEIEGIGGSSGVLDVTGDTINFNNLSDTTSVYFGLAKEEGSIVPTDYYFGEEGSANIHAFNLYLNGTSVYSLFSSINHNHDEEYSKLDHNHDSSYSSINHNHDDVYSPVDHVHAEVYAALVHDHDTLYSKLGHTHDVSDLGGIYTAGLAKEVDDSLIPKE